MMPTDTDLLGRFHAVLVDEIRDQRPELLEAPFTVAEIYQELVPYRTHRGRIGVEINGDYEHLLMRLLAGEGGFLRLQLGKAREALQNELTSRNPNTGLFREYAAADVRLNPRRVAPIAGSETKGREDGDGTSAAEVAAPSEETLELEVAESPPEPELFDHRSEEEGAAAPTAEPEIPGAKAEPAAPAEDEAAPSAENADEDTSMCPWCRGALPDRANLSYCPFCGTDVKVVPCPGCGEAVEPDWRFCIGCGTGVASD